MPRGRQQGIGGALLTLGKNLASGKKLGSGALKGVLKAGVTPGSGIGAGAGLAGELLKKSKKPGLQKLGNVASAAGNVAGMLTGGGGGGGGMLGKLAKGALGAVTGGGGDAAGGGGGGALAGLAKGALGALTGAEGMRVPMENGGKVSKRRKPAGISSVGYTLGEMDELDKMKSMFEDAGGMDTQEGRSIAAKARALQEQIPLEEVYERYSDEFGESPESQARGGVVNYQAGGAVPVDPGAGGSAPVQPAPQGGGAPAAPAPDPSAAAAPDPAAGAAPTGGAAPQQGGGGGLFGGKGGGGFGKKLLKGALLGPAGLLLGKNKGGGGLFGRNQEHGGLVSYNIGGAVPADPAAGAAATPAPDPTAGVAPDPTAGGATPQQGGGGGLGKKLLKGALLGPLALLGKNKGEEGMRVSMENGGRVANEKLMMALENDILRLRGLKKKGLTKFQEGGVVNGGGDTETYGKPRVIKEETTSADFQEDKALTGGDYQPGGTIGAVNPEGGSLDALDDDKKSEILSSQFGQMYLSGEGSLDDQYKDYQKKVYDLIDNNPEEALSKINKMMETNKGFQTKLEGKSDEEKLAITRKMMTDGKIGDFHGTILMGEKEAPLPQFYSPETSNVRSDQGPRILIASGMRALKPDQMEQYLNAAKHAGISREELSKDTEKTRNFLNEYLDEHGHQQSSPSASDEKGTETGGFSQYFINRAKGEAEEALQSRSDQAEQKAKDIYRKMNPNFDARMTEMEQIEAYNEKEGTNFRRYSDMMEDMQRKTKDAFQETKRENLEDITEERRREFVDEYFKSRGINPADATETQLNLADRAFERSLAQGGKINVMRQDSKSYRGGGALSSSPFVR